MASQNRIVGVANKSQEAWRALLKMNSSEYSLAEGGFTIGLAGLSLYAKEALVSSQYLKKN